MDFAMIFTNVALLVGVILLIAVAITHFYPPKKINYMYGYRTARSMKSQQSWDFAQNYSGKRGFEYGCFAVVIGLLLFFIGLEPEQSVIFGLAVTLGMPLYILIPTERALRKNFPE